MKTKLLALPLLLISATTYAQSTSTAEVETALKQFVTEYNKSPYEFFKDRCTPDFRYTSGDGSFTLLPAILKNDEGRPSVESTVSDLKIFRLGDLAVVSGIHAFGKSADSKVAFTYTLEKRKTAGSAPRWLFAASQHTPIRQSQSSSATADEARSEGRTPDASAIKTVLEGHSQAASEGDVEKAVGYFANSPNIAVSHQLPGSGYIRGYQAVTNAYRKELTADSFKKSPDKLTTGNYLYRIVGNTAFVTYIETFTKPDGTVDSRYHKANYLEKENGQWKMIGNFWMPEQKAK